jgi:hypothetical protein
MYFLAKIRNLCEVNNIQKDRVTCCRDEISGLAEFWRMTGEDFMLGIEAPNTGVHEKTRQGTQARHQQKYERKCH